MSDTFIGMIRNIDLFCGFIFECTNLINNLYEHNNYGDLVKQLCNEFVLPIINITKNKHIKEYNKHIKDTKNVDNICSYLMNICSERYFKLSQNEYSKITEFTDNNIYIYILSNLYSHLFMNFLIYLKNGMIVIVIAHVTAIVKKVIENVFVLLINIVNFVKKIILF